MFRQTIAHGGAIDMASRKYGIDADKWLDLSTGINPHAHPVAAIDARHWTRLPLAGEQDALCDAAARYYGLADSSRITCAPGTQALIQTIPFWLAGRGQTGNVHILGPTYGEHALGWQRAGFVTIRHDSAPDQRIGRIEEILRQPGGANDIVVLVNPNNPDGGLIGRSQMAELAELADAQGKWLLIDEAFMDETPGESLCGAIARAQERQFDRIIVLRSFGKFFGLAGARLGFAVMRPDLAESLRERIGPWAIPGPVCVLGRAAFENRDWQETTRDVLRHGSQRRDALMTQGGLFECVGSIGLFGLYQSPRSTEFADFLARNAILVRQFEDQPNWLRLGQPGNDADWARLTQAVTEFACR